MMVRRLLDHSLLRHGGGADEIIREERDWTCRFRREVYFFFKVTFKGKISDKITLSLRCLEHKMVVGIAF